MASKPQLSSELRALYAGESERIRQDFAVNGDGRAAVLARSSLAETILLRLWREMISESPDGPHDFALVALGGFGRRWLFPHSDVDILLLYANDESERSFKDSVRAFSREIWDLRLRLSPAARKISECDRFDPNNVEFVISLLDSRYLGGDPNVYARFHDQLVPRLVARESTLILRKLGELARSRYNKFGDTVFHLEPNVKDGPGGLRDYNLACWLPLIARIEKSKAWPESGLPAAARPELDSALRFLMSARCFLHFRHGRDDNTLEWNAQSEAAEQKIGAPDAPVSDASDWMRLYFSHARAVHRVCGRLLHEAPAATPSLYRQFQNLRSRLSNPEFEVRDDLIHLRRLDSARDPEVIQRTYRFMARHGLNLSSETESRIEQALPALVAAPPRGPELWHNLQDILVAPHAAEALRAMHSSRLLTIVLPELALIDSLVIRDYLHRFTVDEHSFVAIENLHLLRQSQSKWDQRYAELLEELDQPDLLYLALLLHDTGKGLKTDNHVQASLEIAERALARLDLDAPDRETVLFLISRHLEMSAALRRDIFDPETIRQFAEKMETPERLKMLCLLTYADIHAVNPEALTPWKAENIWQLYIGTANYMLRSADERFHADAGDEVMTHLHTLAPAAGKKLDRFLEGLPRRYLRTHPASEILQHIEMAEALARDSVQIALKRGRHWYELTLVMADRPLLFAAMAGVLAAWGMNIVKAAAFSNLAGLVVDTFYFTDRFRTLELNLPEWERFKGSIHDVLAGKTDLERMLRDRLRSQKRAAPKVKVDTQIVFDDSCSSQSTLVEVIAQDQPGLLHHVSSAFAAERCNIEIALIETEGQTATDVFYLTSDRSKLSPAHQERLRAALLVSLAPR